MRKIKNVAEHNCPFPHVTRQLLKMVFAAQKMLAFMDLRVKHLEKIVKSDLGYTDEEMEKLVADEDEMKKAHAEFEKNIMDFMNGAGTIEGVNIAMKKWGFPKEFCKAEDNENTN